MAAAEAWTAGRKGSAVDRGDLSLLAPLDLVVRGLSQLAQGLAESAKKVQADVAKEVSSRLDPVRDGLQQKVAEQAQQWRRQQLGRSLEFWARIIPIYTSYKVCQVRAQGVRTKEERDKMWEKQHEQAAEKLYSLSTELGGFFLKAGQFFSKPDMVPAAWARKLSLLHDSVPPDSFAVIRKAIEEELEGKPLSDVFDWVDEKPLGSASIAQVHKARLKGAGEGQWVAVKVQRKGVEPLMLMDLTNLKHFAAFLQKNEMALDLHSVVSEAESQILDEFDFREEASAMERIGQSLRTGGRSRRQLIAAKSNAAQLSPKIGQKGGKEAAAPKEVDESPVVVPRPIPGLVSKHLLVMEFIDGVPIMRMPEEARRKGIDPNGPFARMAKTKILKDLIQAFGQMMLRDGEFQADPHPGNILILPGTKVALLDYGQRKEFTPEQRRHMARLVIASANRDPIQIGEAMKAAGFETSKTPQEEPKSFIRAGIMMFDTKISPGFTTISPWSQESTLKTNALNNMPKDFIFALKVIQFLRGLGSGMGVNLSAAEMWRPLAVEVLRESTL